MIATLYETETERCNWNRQIRAARIKSGATHAAAIGTIVGAMGNMVAVMLTHNYGFSALSQGFVIGGSSLMVTGRRKLEQFF